MFTEKFYNLKHNKQKRDLLAISLHKHPKSGVNNFFSSDLKSELRMKSREEAKLDPINRDGIIPSQTILEIN